MTRTKFIMKWLGTNKPYDQYHRDEMLEDLDKVIAYAKQAVKNCNTPAVSNSAFKCADPELQPVECEKWRGCFDCPYYRQS